MLWETEPLNNEGHLIDVNYGNVVFVTKNDLKFTKLRQYRWDEGLNNFKEKAKVQEVVRMAVQIYEGHIKGFKDVPEDPHQRLLTLKAELKFFMQGLLQENLAN